MLPRLPLPCVAACAIRKAFISLCSCILLAGGSQAAIIDRGDYLTDTISGLDWLDVTKTVNMSFNTVLSLLDPGDTYEGWRYATGDEFNALVSNYTGIAVIGNYGPIDQEPDRIDGLVTMLGSTLDAYYISQTGKTWDANNGFDEGEGFDYTNGFIADTALGTNNVFAALLYDIESSVIRLHDDISQAHTSSWSKNYFSKDTGSYLVRPATLVSEPNTAALLTLGVFFLVARRCSKGYRN